jgi:membrane-bound lytic murein transglycosylase MltF
MPGSDYSEHWNEARDGDDPEELNDEIEDLFEEMKDEVEDDSIEDKLPNHITENYESTE